MMAMMRRGAKGVGVALAWLCGAALVPAMGGGCGAADEGGPAGDEGVEGGPAGALGLAATKEDPKVECYVDGSGGTRPVACKDAECERQCFLQRMIDCPTCPPPPPNGRGLYIITANDSNYCFVDKNARPFCPDGFLNYGGGVYLRMRDAGAPSYGKEIYHLPVSLELTTKDDKYPAQEAELLRVDSEQTWLSVRYRLKGDVKAHKAQGAGLSALRFRLPPFANNAYHFEFKVEAVPAEYNRPDDSPDTPAWLQRYAVSYRTADLAPDLWQPQCTVGGIHPPSSFVAGPAVDALTGLVKQQDVVTMSCRTGAIDTCMAWGYTPWAEGAGADAPYLFATCLQAKRAAYFVSKGDYNSYTVNRTHIDKRDVFGIAGPLAGLTRLEAAWTPNGAACLNWENLRVPGLGDRLNHEGDVQPCVGDWKEDGPLATGAADLP
jgi:ADYC domain-containing protein